ncbi:YrrS family protein [Bacillus sp. FSL L8-0167]|uniref:YrrS family protein n=1 Tax=Bacillus TaxID=1386 RepID=UPI00061ACABA|nr:YrrS family protein [Bacillus safensis]MBY0190372.1 YrrS family protein [Bacillus aerophilus]KKD43232.1 membrane protein [Bacillus safensis]MCM3451205.1 YrrS family protein [Bacillus safensis]MDP4565358.1 YrrS family protein [Bacillus safensis]MDR6683104.1 cytoskeletal protein RodZ [Bacillus safensis]
MSRNSRFEHRDKRRKANMVLNILIGIVVVLILVVASSLLIFNKPKDPDVAKEPSKTAPATSENKQNSQEDVKDPKKDTSDDSDAKKDDSSDQDDETKKTDDEEKPNKDALKDAKETDGGKTSDVDKTYENDDWEPVGTEQSGSHTATYDSSSKDWKEMIKAMSYATGISEDQMTVLWLGNNGGPQDAKGTIRDKTTGERYRVEITWVDEKGWKPVKVEKLR